MRQPGGAILGPLGMCSANMGLACQAISGLQPHFSSRQPASAELCLILAQRSLCKAGKGACQVRVTTQVQFFQEMSLCSARGHCSPHRHHHGGPPRIAELASGEPAPLELLLAAMCLQPAQCPGSHAVARQQSAALSW